MAARVIQGYFVGRGPGRDLGAVVPRPSPPATLVQARVATGRPALAYAPAGAGTRPSGDRSFEIDPTRLGLARSGGAALPQALLAKMEGAFGADFSQVRVHVGPQASRIGAIAFTTGNDIYFAPGRYQPESILGQQLLGHELAHVIQQRQGRVRASGGGVSVVHDRMLEAEADRMGARAAAHRTLQAKALPNGNGGQVRVSQPIREGDGSYRVKAEIAGRSVGSLRVHVDAGRSARVTDLGVDPGHRSQGIGKMLLASAARAGQRFGKSSVTLTADDNGSGKLNRWYGGLGFARAGSDARGRPRFEAQMGRVLAGAAQPKMGQGAARPLLPPGPPGLVVQRMRAAAAAFGAPIQRAVAAVIPTTTKAGGTITGRGTTNEGNAGGLTATYGNQTINPAGKHHAEPTLCKAFSDAHAALNKNKKKSAPSTPLSAQAFSMNAWPCENCDKLLSQTATKCGMAITVTVTADKGGYSADHKLPAKSTGTITYP